MPFDPQGGGTVLRLRDYGVAFGEQVVLTALTLTVPGRGVTAVLGPSGTGKSALLRSLAGFNAAQPSFRSWGEAEYAGGPLGAADRPALVLQNARLMLDSVFENLASGLPERQSLTQLQQRDVVTRLLARAGLDELAGRLTDEVIDLPLGVQRRLAIARTVAANPRLLLLDEPTAGLADGEADALLALVRAEGDRRAVLCVTHNQEHARRVASRVALIAGGRVWEIAPADQFFDAPSSALARQFVRTGSCCVPAPEPDPDRENPDPEPPPEVDRPTAPTAYGPRGFHWLKPGLLAGTPRPGIIHDVEYDLESLRRVGIKLLVTLEEDPFDTTLLERYGIASLFAPVPDMGAPTVAATADLCRRIDEQTRRGTPVAVHCRAGLGRTGTQLACQLIWEGTAPVHALDRVRQIEPRWVQSDIQVQHLREFAASLGRRR